LRGNRIKVFSARADFLLELSDLLAQRRLLDPEARGGAREVQFLGNRDKIAEMAQFHGRRYPSNMKKHGAIYWTGARPLPIGRSLQF
jgi:hypothetical protein